MVHRGLRMVQGGTRAGLLNEGPSHGAPWSEDGARGVPVPGFPMRAFHMVHRGVSRAMPYCRGIHSNGLRVRLRPQNGLSPRRDLNQGHRMLMAQTVQLLVMAMKLISVI
jgi:hypothetical protein